MNVIITFLKILVGESCYDMDISTCTVLNSQLIIQLLI